MQKKKSVIIAVCLILSLFSSGWTGDIFKIEISPDDLNFKKVNSYDIVELRGCSFTTKVGEPMLPVKSIFVALGAKNIEKIKLIDVKKNELPGTYNILPVQTPQPFLINHQTAGFDPPKQSVYLLSSPYPEIIIKHIHTGSLRWENIGSINIFPLQYNPSEKKLILNTVICFEIEYSTPTFPMLPSRFQKDDAFNTDMRIIKDMIKGLVINPDDVSLPPFIKKIKNKKNLRPEEPGEAAVQF